MKLIKQLRDYANSFPVKEKEYLEALVKEGGRVAEGYLASAETSSPNQAYIDTEINKFGGEISLVGEEKGGAGFVEFGTGTKYTSMAESHPRAYEFGAIRGEYGEGKGRKPPWIFHGEAGVTGEELGGGFVETYGQPASRVMWKTQKRLEASYLDIAKEVFKK